MSKEEYDNWEKDKETRLFYWGEYQTWNDAQREIASFLGGLMLMPVKLFLIK